MYWCFGIHHRSDTCVLPNNWMGMVWERLGGGGGESSHVQSHRRAFSSFFLVMLVWWLASTCWHTFNTWPDMYLTMGSVIQVNTTHSTSTKVDTARQLALCYYTMILTTFFNAYIKLVGIWNISWPTWSGVIKAAHMELRWKKNADLAGDRFSCRSTSLRYIPRESNGSFPRMLNYPMAYWTLIQAREVLY